MQLLYDLGSAARLAEKLADGTPCPVCGAISHPHPAVHAEDIPTAQELDAAAQALTALDAMRLAEGAHIARDFEKRLARLEEQRAQVKEIAPTIVADYRAHLMDVLAEFLEP